MKCVTVILSIKFHLTVNCFIIVRPTTVILRCYIVGGSETGDVSRDRCCPKRNVKMVMVVPENLFAPGKKDIHTDEKVTNL